MSNSSILIGIAGGTGSGKTSIANYLLKQFGNDELIVIEQDSYYKDNSNLSMDERNQQNFDHPSYVIFETPNCRRTIDVNALIYEKYFSRAQTGTLRLFVRGKNIFRRQDARPGIVEEQDPNNLKSDTHPRPLTKHVIRPTRDEIKNNHRSRSARMRVAEQIKPTGST